MLGFRHILVALGMLFRRYPSELKGAWPALAAGLFCARSPQFRHICHHGAFFLNYNDAAFVLTFDAHVRWDDADTVELRARK
jgi:hypothetical protein